MTIDHTLFDAASDWLEHTLEHAAKDVSETHTQLADGTRITRKALGVLEVTPPADRPNPNAETLIISAGVHGNETAPIEVLNGLVNELLNGEWHAACPMLLILGNPAAMIKGDRFVDANMNRLFHGAHRKAEYQGLPEAVRAQQLEEFCRDFAGRYTGALNHYDLHTAIRPSQREKFALYPFVEGRQVPADQCDFLLEADVETLLLQHKEGTTFSSFSSSELGAESFTIELGKVRPFGQNDLSRFTGIRDALRRRFRGHPAPAQASDRITVFKVVYEILNTGDSFEFHIPDDVANFTAYGTGEVIWEDKDTRYTVGDIPESIVFPNRQVPVGQRVGLLIRPLQRDEA
ncbi:succinylglutamate desuccinylase [Marinobacter salinisoli]|uniref:Succinylglutamate desuccinylase n=1 Tax=Marinobacter salinisoli TaxID=2769486 RepID=A0ABX7MRR0_9GAMM|nr:succinylglutamate desuccinylase [Marinobacter salinisoli]QSP94993.1 succinylglutamate desuccinylase [Marinobacter salinisoli]